MQPSLGSITSKVGTSPAQSKMTTPLAISSREKAFGITELCEAILLQLPPKDTLLATRVCKYWKEVIEESPDLQTHLFLKAAELEGAFKTRAEDVQPTHWSEGENLEVIGYYRTDDLVPEQDLTHAAPNPLLFVAQPPFAEAIKSLPLKKADIHTRASYGEYLEIRRRLLPASDHAIANGRYLSMYLTQPPTKQARIKFSGAPDHTGLRMSNQDGLRFQDLLGPCDDFLDGQPENATCLRVVVDAMIFTESTIIQPSIATLTSPNSSKPEAFEGFVQVAPGHLVNSALMWSGQISVLRRRI